MTQKAYFERNYDINSYNCDDNFKLKLSSLVDFLQDIAILHSVSVKCGYYELKEMGLAWVLYKWKIRITKLPTMGETLLIRTWSSGIDRRQAYRSFHIFTQTGELIGEALSVWFLLDIEQRTIAPISEAITNKYTNTEEYVLKNKFTNNPLALAKNKIFESQYTVLQHHLDYNNHVNNAKYVEIFTDTITPELLSGKSSYDLEITYKKECVLGAELSCICFDTEISSSDDTVIAIIKESDIENNRQANVLLKLKFI